MAQATAFSPAAERIVDPDATRAYTLPKRYYLDPEIYEREKEAIFYRTWQYVCHHSHVAESGDYVTCRIADENVLIIRSGDGGLRGFYNVCRHRAHELLEGAGNVETIVCPYHAWSYHTDGRLRHARNAERVEGFDPAEFCLRPIEVEQFCGFVFVNLDPGAEALSVLAGALEADLRARVPYLDQLQPTSEMSFGPGSGIAANWKVVVDNFLECYHCANAHPAFADMIEMSRYQQDTFDVWSRQLGPQTRHRNVAYEFSPDAANQCAAFWFVWPCTTINLLPGDAGLSVSAIRPLGLEEALFAGHYYRPNSDSCDRAREDYVADILGIEDQRLCESVQRGLKSRSYNQGRFIVDAERGGTAEHAVHHFHRLVVAALDGR